MLNEKESKELEDIERRMVQGQESDENHPASYLDTEDIDRYFQLQRKKNPQGHAPEWFEPGYDQWVENQRKEQNKEGRTWHDELLDRIEDDNILSDVEEQDRIYMRNQLMRALSPELKALQDEVKQLKEDNSKLQFLLANEVETREEQCKKTCFSCRKCNSQDDLPF